MQYHRTVYSDWFIYFWTGLLFCVISVNICSVLFWHESVKYCPAHCKDQWNFICSSLHDKVHLYCRCALDAEILKYVGEAYPKGVCSVYCVNGKDVEGLGSDFELVVVISATKHSPQNFWCVKSVIWNSFLAFRPFQP